MLTGYNQLYIFYERIDYILDNEKTELEEKKPTTIFFITKENEKISAFTCIKSNGFPLPNKNDEVILKSNRYIVLNKTFKFIEMGLDKDDKIVLEIDILISEIG